MKNILTTELLSVQIQYREILVNAKNQLSIALPNEVLNEITSFWHRNKNIVKCALNWLSYCSFETYLFTAAVNLDVNEKDHYPFLLMGSTHILDDPVFKYATTAPATIELGPQFIEYRKKIVLEAIEDNIKILDNFQGIILILPVNCMFNNFEVVDTLAKKALLGFFNDSVSSLEEINQKCKTFKDIEKFLNPLAYKQIIFNGFDDLNTDLSERFSKQKDHQNEHGYPDSINEFSNFIFTLYSYLFSASSVIEICTKFHMIPYLRHDVIFHYFTLMLRDIRFNYECDEVETLLFKAQIVYSAGRIINRDLFADIDINVFNDLCRKFNFDSKLAAKYKELTIHSENISLVDMIDSVLNDFYVFCGTI